MTTISRSIAGAVRALSTYSSFSGTFRAQSVIKLEQNYRSTATILNAANAVIENNSARVGKNLWTDGSEGELIKVYSAYNERDEADFIVSRLREWSDQGNPKRADAAVLLSLKRAVTHAGGGLDQRRPTLSRLRRPALFRTRGDQGRARLSHGSPSIAMTTIPRSSAS